MAKKHRNMSKPTSQNSPNHTNKRQANSHKTANATLANGILDKKQARREAKHLGLNKADLPNSIKEIIATLTEAGYEAYIVGGGVRDALLGLRPKDFDAVTNATPNQIKDVFGKRCRIIGRRFQLCHVYSGRDMIEVATFRAPPKDDTFTTDAGMLMRDNVWGNIYQDVVRRDFSINALYYQPFEGIVYDFCGGLADISQKTLRLLGDAQKRIEEDPVRLLRALRFKAKLGFSFSPDLQQQFNTQNWSLLAHVSPHRLYDETQKMFTGGYLIPLLPLLFDYRAFEHLIFYPPTAITPLVERVAINTDKRINESKSINPAFFYASILWENYLFLLDKFKKNMPFAEAQNHAANKVMDKQRDLTAMPKFAEQFIKDIWLMQPRLAEPRRKNIQKLYENPRFRAGFDFLHLREMVQSQNGFVQTLDTDSTNHMGDWWAWFQTLNAKQQQQAISDFDLEKVKQRFGNTAKNTGKNNKNSPRPQSRLSQQEQGEKEQLRQLSLANKSNTNSPTQTAKPLWETNFDEKGLPQTAPAHTDSYDLHSTPRQSRRERRLANQAPQKQVAQSSDLLNSEKPRVITKNQAAQASQLVEQAVPARRKRREPSSVLSVKERLLGEAGVSPMVENSPANDAGETKPKRARKPKVSVEQAVTQLAENVAVTAETVEPTTTKPPVKRTRKKTIENVEKAEIAAKKVAETAQKLPEKSPVKPTRQKVVGTPEPQPEKSIKVVETIAEKTPVKRGRKPKVMAESDVAKSDVAEDSKALLVKSDTTTEISQKPPVKRTRKSTVKTDGNTQ